MDNAFEAGRTDGAEWARDLKRDAKSCEEEFDPAAVEKVLGPGNYSADEGLINALDRRALYRVLGLAETAEWGSDEWRAALDRYNAGFAAGAREEARPTTMANVMDYQTGAKLDGEASEALAERSAEAGDTGASPRTATTMACGSTSERTRSSPLGVEATTCAPCGSIDDHLT